MDYGICWLERYNRSFFRGWSSRSDKLGIVGSLDG